MNATEKLDEFLSQEYTVDYWSDVAILDGHKLIRQLTPDAWIWLTSEWRAKSPHWQHHLAEILPNGNRHYTFPILLDMLDTADDELIIIAVDGLREFDRDLVDSALHQLRKRRLIALSKSRGGIVSRVIDDLLKTVQSEVSDR